MKFKATRSVLFLTMVFAYLVLSGRSSCLNDGDMETLESPVQAVALVYEHPDGMVSAELVIISTYDGSHFVDAATNVLVEMPDGTRLDLVQDSSGHYAVTSLDDADLYYEPGGSYLFKFDLDEMADTGPDHVDGYFVGEVVAPSERPDSLVVEDPPVGPDHAVTISWSPAFDRGLYAVYGPDGELTDPDFDFSTPDFDGSKWSSLLARIPAEHLISGQAFQDSGDYVIEYAGCSFVEGFQDSLSSELGVLSGFLACSAIDMDLYVP